jgi:pimeloyl-ACP methyl ester carboxylesterase
VLAAVATGCSSSSSSPSPITSPPKTSPASSSPSSPPPAATGSPAALKRFYTQHLSWQTCDSHFQCSSLLVPVDYSKPTGATLHVAVIRVPSSGTSEGSLIMNPGGPGGSGVQFIEQGGASTFAQLTEHLDLVSFDPRGVGASDPIRCLTSAQTATFVNAEPVPATPAQLNTLVSEAKFIANACYKHNGSLLEHVGTIDQARDMDVLRAALGDAKLTYYGASYGTYLGAKYAQLFPHNIRAMVLDGALNPDEGATQENLVQAKGFQTDLDDFLAACARSGSCPLGSTESAAAAGLNALTAQITAHPLSVGSRPFGAGEFFEGLAFGLYSTTYWSALEKALGGVKDGNAGLLQEFADFQTERNANGTYSNLIDSNTAINCIDRPAPRSVSAYVAAAKIAAKAAPSFGAAIEYSSLPCAFWRVPPVEKLHPVHAKGAPPILVIGTTRDPATPYVWAQALASQLSSGVLLTHVGDGHTAYRDGNPCVDTAVKNYVLDLKPPAPNTTCS